MGVWALDSAKNRSSNLVKLSKYSLCIVTFAMGTAAEHVSMLLSTDHRLLIQFELYVFTPVSAV